MPLARDLGAALRDPGFTPGARDLAALVAIAVGDDEQAAHLAERALDRAAIPAATSTARALDAERGAPRRRRLVRLLGRLVRRAPDDAHAAALAGALVDADASVRRAAAVALGRLEARAFEADLVAALDRESDEAARRALVAALGKAGGDLARAALAEGPAGALGATTARSRLLLLRDAARSTQSSVDLEARLPVPTRVTLRCRAGLEPLLADELAILSPTPLRQGPLGARLEVVLGGSPSVLLAARTLLTFGFPLESEEAKADALPEAIARSLTSPAALALLRALTRGPIRVRVAWARGGKRRATMWRIAEAIAARGTEVVNDPRDAPWEAVVHEAPGRVDVELVPHFADPRFAYRTRDVPAASHPTIAAALARVASVRADDVVWDPFCGSGLELCERALLGPYAHLIGSDLDTSALEAARENLAAVGAHDVELAQGDALVFTPTVRPTLVITNPPLGRRVARDRNLGPLLEGFVVRAGHLLAPGGRIVWLSPFPARTATAAASAGFSVVDSRDVDLGGFTAALQVLRKG